LPAFHSTFLGGSSFDSAAGIALGVDAGVYITGETRSVGFPTMAGAFQTTFGGGQFDAFVTRIDLTQAVIDIKPGSFPTSIDLGSGGTVPVAIFSTADFDATTVDPTTVTLASAPVKLKGKGTPMASFEDVDGDGLLDLVVHVSTEALQLSAMDTEAVLEDTTFGGASIRGIDTIRVVP